MRTIRLSDKHPEAPSENQDTHPFKRRGQRRKADSHLRALPESAPISERPVHQHLNLQRR